MWSSERRDDTGGNELMGMGMSVHSDGGLVMPSPMSKATRWRSSDIGQVEIYIVASGSPPGATTHRCVGVSVTANRIGRTAIAEEASRGRMFVHLVLSLNASNAPYPPPTLTSLPSHVHRPRCHAPTLDDFPHNHQRPSIQRTSVAIPRSIAPKPVPIQTFSTTISAVTASPETAFPPAVLPANRRTEAQTEKDDHVTGHPGADQRTTVFGFPNVWMSWTQSDIDASFSTLPMHPPESRHFLRHMFMPDLQFPSASIGSFSKPILNSSGVSRCSPAFVGPILILVLGMTGPHSAQQHHYSTSSSPVYLATERTTLDAFSRSSMNGGKALGMDALKRSLKASTFAALRVRRSVLTPLLSQVVPSRLSFETQEGSEKLRPIASHGRIRQPQLAWVTFNAGREFDSSIQSIFDLLEDDMEGLLSFLVKSPSLIHILARSSSTSRFWMSSRPSEYIFPFSCFVPSSLRPFVPCSSPSTIRDMDVFVAIYNCRLSSSVPRSLGHVRIALFFLTMDFDRIVPILLGVGPAFVRPAVPFSVSGGWLMPQESYLFDSQLAPLFAFWSSRGLGALGSRMSNRDDGIDELQKVDRVSKVSRAAVLECGDRGNWERIWRLKGAMRRSEDTEVGMGKYAA
ncbi:hypothetical protein NMY22_g12419 [Coprinellus aureogranulatus]|nr:hypothetical protein NMY22_g12419 [Coprinellus aureogranulatus]